MAKYSVSPGDCFASIAKANNYFNYRTLYDHPDNAAIKAKRPNPNQLAEDDVVAIPAKRQKTVNLVLDKSKVFVVDRKKTKLRLAVTDAKKTALAPTTCSLTVGSAVKNGAPGGQGLLELEVDPEQTRGTLTMSFPALPAFGATPADPAAANPPANPPTILPSQYKDKAPKLQTDALEVEWDLRIGKLEPKAVTRGSLQRLNNLTFDTPIRTDENKKTRLYVKGYQALKKAANETGNVSDIRDELATFHDTL